MLHLKLTTTFHALTRAHNAMTIADHDLLRSLCLHLRAKRKQRKIQTMESGCDTESLLYLELYKSEGPTGRILKSCCGARLDDRW